MKPEVDKFYWVRFYRDNAAWEVAKRSESAHQPEDCWFRAGMEMEYYDSETNKIGPEAIPPADDWEVVE